MKIYESENENAGKFKQILRFFIFYSRLVNHWTLIVLYFVAHTKYVFNGKIAFIRVDNLENNCENKNIIKF